jgi:uncharacterized protein YigE (DUF2233 family)
MINRAQGSTGVIPPRPAALVSAPIYALVTFDGPSRRVSEVLVAFEDVAAAVRFANNSGIQDYTVAPMGFHVDSRDR